MGHHSVDLNADVGESFGRWVLGDDAGVLAVVSSANVACGFHAGDATTLRRCCEAAVARGVSIGAQVGYRDLAGFGRRFIDYDAAELTADVLYQLGALDGLARVAAGGGRGVAYVKPHGALYHATATHEGQAAAVLEAVQAYAAATGAGLPLLGQPGSRLLDLARAAGVPVVHEVFADRGYRGDGTLVPRAEAGALLEDPEEVADRVLRMVRDGEVEAVDGTVVAVDAASVCLHGDAPGAVATARAVRSALDGAGVAVEPFA